MRGFIFSVAVFVLTAIGLFFCSDYMTSTFSSLSETLEKTSLAMEKNDFESAEAHADALSSELNEKAAVLCFFCDRRPIGDAVIQAERLKSFIWESDASSARAELCALRVMLSNMAKKAVLTTENIF